MLLPEPPHRERERRSRPADPAARRPGRGPRGCRRARARAGPASAADRRRTAGRPPRSRAPRTSRGAGPGSASHLAVGLQRSAAYARIVSRSRKRGSPSAVSSTLIRLWSASAISPSRTSPPTSSAGPQIASAEVDVAAAGEDRQPVEQAARPRVEQVVAPGDRAAQRLLAGGQVARPRREDVELVVESDEDRVRREDLDPGGGELDGQRHPMEAGADARDGRRVLVGHGEPGLDGDGPLDEQADRGVLAERDGIDDARLAAGRLIRSRLLSWLGSGGVGRPGTGYSCSPETCSTARLVTMTLMSGAARSRSATIGGGGDDLLEVVEDEQQPLVAQPVGEELGDRAAGALRRRRPRPRSAAPTSIGSRTGSSATKKTPSGKSSAARAASCERESRLAGPARPGQGQQPGRCQQAGRLVQLRVAADERGELRRQVVRPRVDASASGGNSAGSPSATTWKMRTGEPRSRSRCSPMSRSVTPAWTSSISRAWVWPVARIWPPWATAARRAARLIATPTR